MDWITLVTVGKDAVGSSESWDIEIANTGDHTFAWRTSGSDGGCEQEFESDEEDELEDADEDIEDGQADNDDGEEPEAENEEPIDTGSAEFIAEYILENAQGFETELRDGLHELSKARPEFLVLLVAVENLLAPPGSSWKVN